MCKLENKPDINSKNLITKGIHHLGISVPDIKETARFFINQLNFKQVGEKPNYPAVFVSDETVMITIWQIKDDKKMVKFDRHNNVGLHHFALNVSSKKQLQIIHEQLIHLDNVSVEFSPEPLEGTQLMHMMCIIPGGVRLELISG